MQNTVEKAESSATTGLLVSNALTLIVALVLKWPLATVIWPYWLQSAIIGWYAGKRMLALRNEKGKRFTVSFFVIHYGLFHLAYLLFLFNMPKLNSAWDYFWIIVCGISYAFAQRKTFQQQTASDARGSPNLGNLMFLPYLRILPIHLTILFGSMSNSTFTLLLFMPMKTAADILFDKFDRRIANQIK